MIPYRLYFLLLLVLAPGIQAQQIDNLEQQAGNLARQFYQQQNLAPGNGGIPVPEAVTMQSFVGHTSNEQFGANVTSAGDVNGDGYNDIIIGASSYMSNTGRAYIYYGGPLMNTIADVTLTGEMVGSNFGFTLAGPGDLNGDGYADVVVGAYGANSGTGRVYVYFGGGLMNSGADVILDGEGNSNFFGTSLSGAGDVNGDGYPDIIIGANGNNSNNGKAYIYYGRPAFGAPADVYLTGNAYSYFGSTVAGLGDVNGDGYADVAVGEYPWSANTGRVFVYYGGSPMNTDPDVTMFGQNAGDKFGKSIAGGRDINGDGYADVVISSYGYNSGDGKLDIFYGGTAIDQYPEMTIGTPVSTSDFGFSVALADVNGDGYGDIIAGASRNYGAAFIYSGGSTLDGFPDAYLNSEGANNYFGFSVGSAGDMDNDGFDEILVGATGNNSYRGKAYLYKSKLTGSDTPDMVLKGGANSWLGWSVASAGDVNGDGYNDIIVGAPRVNSYTGAVYLFYGGYTLENSPDVTFTGEYFSDRFGAAVAGAGDVNGDGFTDIIVGAHLNDVGGTDAGRAYLFYGSSSMDNVVDITFTGESAGSWFGSAVASAGDVNGDGYTDILVGAPNMTIDDSVSAGKQYLYFGGSGMDNIADKTESGFYSGTCWGRSLASAGDVNGDGFSDFIVGGTGHKNESSNTVGAAILYFGGTNINNFNSTVLYGKTEYYLFGSAVSSAGDVNGDGYADIIIRDRVNVYLYAGSQNNTLTPLLSTVRGAGNADFIYGTDITSAGDVNGDGYSDLLIGCPSSAYTMGKAYILFGGASMDSIPDIIFNGTNAAENFGASVSALGDMNGDGLADVIVGGYYNNLNGVGAGAASIFLSSAPSPKPRILSVADVPRDQGGKVNITFFRSGYDLPGMNKITGYKIERSVPPGMAGFSWNHLTTITPGNNTRYCYEAATQSDSGAYFYRVTATTTNANEYWRSNVLSGISLDNLAPTAVKNFTISAQGSANRLSWKLNSETDLKQYLLYRSNTNTIDPASATEFAATTDSVLTDNSPLNGESYYFIVPQDIHNNTGPVTNLVAPHAVVNITAFIEGFYNEQTDEQIADTVTVYLCSTTAPYTKIDSATAQLSSTGAASVKFFNAVTGSYYLVITHRNSIETWSKLDGEAITKGASVNYNFSLEAARAFGNNLKQKGSRWCLFSGDVNQDGIVDFGDLTLIDNDAYNFSTGYLSTDLSGDAFTDFTDLTICDNNSYNFIQVMKPGGAFKQPAIRGLLKTKLMPLEFSVSDNYPNPFNPSTKIDYALPKDSKVNITVYSILGEKVMEVISNEQRVGYHTVSITMNNFASGAYLIRFTADEFVQTKKILLTK